MRREPKVTRYLRSMCKEGALRESGRIAPLQLRGTEIIFYKIYKIFYKIVNTFPV